jgi:hypothetical protein
VRELVRSTLPWGVSLESVPIPRPAIQDPHGWRADCCLVELSHGLGRDGCGSWRQPTGGEGRRAGTLGTALLRRDCFSSALDEMELGLLRQRVITATVMITPRLRYHLPALTGGAATDVAGTDAGVVAVAVAPRVITLTTGWAKVVFVAALPDPAKIRGPGLISIPP